MLIKGHMVVVNRLRPSRSWKHINIISKLTRINRKKLSFIETVAESLQKEKNQEEMLIMLEDLNDFKTSLTNEV